MAELAFLPGPPILQVAGLKFLSRNEAMRSLCPCVSLTDIADHKSYFRDLFPHSCSPALLAQASQDY